jgi:hypothetical protein
MEKDVECLRALFDDIDGLKIHRKGIFIFLSMDYIFKINLKYIDKKKVSLGAEWWLGLVGKLIYHNHFSNYNSIIQSLNTYYKSNHIEMDSNIKMLTFVRK